MSRWADWFPVTPAEAEQLLRAADDGDAAVTEVLQPWLERLEELPLHVDMDKAWEPIHRCLTGDDGAAHRLDFEAGEYPINMAVLGGEPLLEEGYRSAALIPAADMPAVAAALAGVKRDWFRERFFALPDTQFHEINEEIFEWVWAHFEDLPPFFAKAAAESSAVICTISH
jgi:Domain of unknown function (DUF1877)